MCLLNKPYNDSICPKNRMRRETQDFRKITIAHLTRSQLRKKFVCW